MPCRKRDPARIKRVTDLLFKLWSNDIMSDLRLGQLLSFLSPERCRDPDDYSMDNFYVEDCEWEQILQEHLDCLEKKNEAS